MKITEHSDFYIKFNNKNELEMFCSYINENFPNKFRWANKSISVKKIMPNYIINEEEMSIHHYLHINPHYIFTYASKPIHNISTISIYELYGMNNKLQIPSWLLTI